MEGSPTGLDRLPYDVLLQISFLLPATDIIHLLSTCRTFHLLACDEYIWKTLSKRIGLDDITGFGGRSFRTVYTGLLHAYAPLLGLWAGDHPFTGQILGFRLDLGGDGRSPGIVGEIWRFKPLDPEEFDDPGAIQQPLCVPALRIGFAVHASDDQPAVVQNTTQAMVSCSVDSSTRPSHPAQLTIVSETTEGIFLHTRHGQHQHPAFPHPAWHDHARPFPKISVTPSLSVTSSGFLDMPSRPLVPICFKAATDVMSPRAISITYAGDCIDSLAPFLGFKSSIRDPPRYYPLHTREDCGTISADVRSHAAHLTGLWLGTYGPHGTECLFLTYDDTTKSLRAIKVTGDENVPRGAVSWDVSTAEACQLSGQERDLWSRTMGGVVPAHTYRGQGAISARGYMPHQRMQFDVILTVIGPDELRLLWIDDGDVLGLKRYRDHTVTYCEHA
ncbi:uncharacterized protein C8Q71DRAFT_713697 [Rhodofomes roseus]|uniref:F-box domain-containing protein n=1 Tax=Rhodofomes roseus TaxID=34475 RepID=A0ABQ8K6J5_9APHY|nr:uncharacterized protein C8Q71DRAFT_713697 [Rhodofomes roseus]KAH9832870.1 hypothetical protein C8Q71DRAFT_713697 [Rhodofomes roseus]